MRSNVRETDNSHGGLLTPVEVAKELRVTAEQVRTLIRKGHLAAINVGIGQKRPLYRITPQAVETFLSQRWQPGPANRPKRSRRLPPVMRGSIN